MKAKWVYAGSVEIVEKKGGDEKERFGVRRVGPKGEEKKGEP